MTAPASPFLIVAIDGGAASGKSTSSRILSERFNLLHSDTGSYYRALTAELLRHRVSPADLAGVKAALATIALATRVTGRSATLELGGHAIPDAEIRRPEVNASVATFAAIPEVRAALLDYQRSQAGTARTHGFRGLVMEGRDIGSKIFPDADLRFFLFADPVERARRRAQEGQQDQIAKRDSLDDANLRRSREGAIVIDSTCLTIEQVVQHMSDLIAAKLAAA